VAVWFGELDEPHTEGQLRVRALDPSGLARARARAVATPHRLLERGVIAAPPSALVRARCRDHGIALEKRDVDRDQHVVYVRRSFTKRELKHPKTEASMRAVPLQARALDALTGSETATARRCSFPVSEAATSTSITSPLPVAPAQEAVGITPLRQVYDLRHTFATFALRAGISTFDLSRYMGASLTMIDRHYGHLARDGREHAIKLLDALNAPAASGGRSWTLRGRRNIRPASAQTTEEPK
jgi:hypothetical protein